MPVVSILSMHPDLTAMASGLWNGWPVHLQHGRDPLWESYYSRFLIDADYVIGADEDCFVKNRNQIESLIDFMVYHNIGLAGMPENAGLRSYSGSDINGMFYIINQKICRPLLPPKEFIEGMVRAEKLPEDYWHIFRHFKNHGVGMYKINTRMHSDGDSVILDFKGEDLLIHTWYAREWGTPEQRERITARYKEVL